ncbi:MAG: hypothetical protein LBS86_08230 [Treponema sp.]|jgi:uncharacterized integral membrane protein|nr:hypothetical protein [Treponema sp.]
MIRLLGLIIVFGVMLFFIVLNTGDTNKCDIKYWFGENAVLRQVPVFLTVFISFALGMICAFPVTFFIRLGKKKRAEKKAGGKLMELEGGSELTDGNSLNGKR